MEFIQQLDEQIVLFVSENFQNTTLDGLMIGISALGNSGMIFIAVAILMILLGKRKSVDWRQRGILLLLCLGITALFANLLLKPFVARIRPFDLLGLSILIPPPHDFSFPSGHTAAAFATAAAFLFFDRKLGVVFLIIAILMGFSRLYLLVHFPSDILFGAVLGTVLSLLTLRIWQFFCKQKKKG